MKNIKNYAKSYKLKKSKIERCKDRIKKSTFDFKDTNVAVDSMQHIASESSASPELLNYLSSSIDADIKKIKFAKGMLTVYPRETGIYSAFFEDNEGQVVEKFTDMTIPVLAKSMEIKQLYVPPTPEPTSSDSSVSDIKSLHIKVGDIDIEIKKSISSFVKNFKYKKDKQVEVIKAIQSWRRNSNKGRNCKSNLSAAKELLSDWEKYSEEFYQVLHAMSQRDE